jgi:ribosome maturation factor RimP
LNIAMPIAHQKLDGLDAARVVAAVEPVLAAHGVDAVELLWKTDRGERLLELTLEIPGTRVPGEGVTLELCSEVSRDVSAALDVADAIPAKYRLDVGSPGLDRALYSAGDYARFAGQVAKLKLREAIDNQRVVRGTLQGLDGDGKVVIETERGLLTLEPSAIESARLVFEWRSQPSTGRPQASGRGRKPPRHQGSR